MRFATKDGRNLVVIQMKGQIREQLEQWRRSFNSRDCLELAEFFHQLSTDLALGAELLVADERPKRPPPAPAGMARSHAG